jgi:uncharacterized Zn-finger protein
MTDEIDTISTDNLICPYCGREYEDEAGELHRTPHELTCDECGKKFSYEIEYSWTFTSYKECEK